MRALVLGVYIAILISATNLSRAAQVTLAWDPSTDPTVVSYHLYYGGASRSYTNILSCGAQTSVTVSNLPGSGTYYFAATSLNGAGLESDFSIEVAYQAGSTNATVTFSNLLQVYDGTPKSVSCVTTPAGLPVSVTYNGSASAPVASGSYVVIATITDTNYSGTATNLFTLSKAVANVQLSGLQQVYDGNGKAASAVTVPAGLALTCLYNGSATLPVNAGTYQVVASVNDSNYAGGVTNSFTISKAVGFVQLSALSQVYDGTARRAAIVTTPSGLPIATTYNGLAFPPTNSGIYQVIAAIADPNYSGSSTGTLAVAKAFAPVQLSGLSQTFDGTPKTASTLSVPANLTITLTYNGTITPPVNAGSYQAVATVMDSNYLGGTTNTLTIAKAVATMQLSGLSQVYDGSAKTVTVGTIPAGIALSVTYNGSTLAPRNAGTYPVVASVTDANYLGSVTGMLAVAKAAAVIQLTGLNQVYDGAPKYVGTSSTPPGLACPLTYNGLGTLPINAGAYLVVGTVADANYTGVASNTLSIAKAGATISFSGLNQAYDGTPKTVSVATMPQGLPVVVTYGGQTVAPTRQGTYQVIGTILHSNYVGTATNTLTIVKSKGRPGVTALALASRAQVYSQLTAKVSPTPGPTVRWVPFNGTLTLLHSSDLVTWSILTTPDASAGYVRVPEFVGAHFFKAATPDGDLMRPVPLRIEQH